MSTVLHYLNQQEIATAVYDYIKKTRPEALPPGSGFKVSLYVQSGEFTARLEATSPPVDEIKNAEQTEKTEDKSRRQIRVVASPGRSSDLQEH